MIAVLFYSALAAADFDDIGCRGLVVGASNESNTELTSSDLYRTLAHFGTFPNMRCKWMTVAVPRSDATDFQDQLTHGYYDSAPIDVIVVGLSMAIYSNPNQMVSAIQRSLPFLQDVAQIVIFTAPPIHDLDPRLFPPSATAETNRLIYNDAVIQLDRNTPNVIAAVYPIYQDGGDGVHANELTQYGAAMDIHIRLMMRGFWNR